MKVFELICHVVHKRMNPKTLLFYCLLASALGLQIGLIVTVLLLLGLGAAVFTYFYRRR